ncbi:MAG: uroporphyrinogen decarboxylase family protein [Lentisphaeria bacterium]|nr:uroporphyrinogen decarboxylase family protein [Lentisphaeria bacterium]
MAELRRQFPSDFGYPVNPFGPSARARGNLYLAGTSVDSWGVVRVNLQDGIIGEVHEPILPDPDHVDLEAIKPPYETFPADTDAARDQVNRDCAKSDLFMFATGHNPQPWEQYQFLRGTENAMMDVMLHTDTVAKALAIIHEFYLRSLDLWLGTDVDAITMSDDWGSQDQLLIPPALWRQLFKPLYRDYCELAHAHGKFIFFHSDGHISAVYEDLVEVGFDAVNSQLFCMDMSEVARKAKGQLTFWGEIDRQHVLNAADPQVARDAVRDVARHLYDPAGGIIAQLEFSLGTVPANVTAVFEEWDRIHEETHKA